MRTIKWIISRSLGCVCVLLSAFMTCMATYQVVARYVFGNPSTISEDALNFSFIWLSLLGTALVFGDRGHMRLSYFVEKAKPELRVCLDVLAELFILAMAVIVFCIGGSGFVGVGSLQSSPTLGVTLDWIYAVMPISGVLIAMYCVINIVELVQDYQNTAREAAR